MGCAVDQPSRMIADYKPNEDGPDHPRPSAEREESHAKQNLKRNIEISECPIEWFGVEVGREMPHFLVRGQRDIVPVEPLYVRPFEAAPDAVRVALVCGMCVMLAVHRHPSNRIALQRQGSKNGE